MIEELRSAYVEEFPQGHIQGLVRLGSSVLLKAEYDVNLVEAY